MLGELGTMHVRSRSDGHLRLTLTRRTAVVGWLGLVVSLIAAFPLAGLSPWLAGLACVSALVSWMLATTRHSLEFDRDDGVVRVERHVLGLGTNAVVPLFHLRAVVVRSRGEGHGFTASLERRAGGAIVIDQRDRAAPLYELARAIADVTELRLVYDTTHPS